MLSDSPGIWICSVILISLIMVNLLYLYESSMLVNDKEVDIGDEDSSSFANIILSKMPNIAQLNVEKDFKTIQEVMDCFLDSKDSLDPNYPNTISGEWVWAPNLTIGPKTSYRAANNGFTFCRRTLGNRYWETPADNDKFPFLFYKWVPKKPCRKLYHEWNKKDFCRLMNGRDLLVVGDSISLNFHNSILTQLNPNFNQSEGHQRHFFCPGYTLCKEEGYPFFFKYVTNDYLTLKICSRLAKKVLYYIIVLFIVRITRNFFECEMP